ncbi:MAG: hypothetical protein ACOC21_03875, partial [Halanaerobiales bacterium]
MVFKRKKLIALLLTITALSLVLVGCGGPEAEEDPVEIEEEESEEEMPEDEGVEEEETEEEDTEE